MDFAESPPMAGLARLSLLLVLPFAACTGQVMDGAARLTVVNAALVSTTLSTDTSCGFASDAVTRAVKLDGQVGAAGGHATYVITTPCLLDFDAHPPAQTCNAPAMFASGRVLVTGTMTVTGVLTGDATTPIIPTGRDAVELPFDAQYDEFRSGLRGTDGALTVHDGRLTGTVQPRLAIDPTTGACSVPSADVSFAGLRYQHARASLVASGMTFEIPFEDSSLDAQSGTNGMRTNFLAGTLVSGGTSYAIPTSGPQVLDPSGAAPATMSSCVGGPIAARSDDDCSLEHVVGLNVARLTVLTAGTLAGRVVSNASFGFASPVVQLSPSDVTGNAGQEGSMAWSEPLCEVGAKSQTVVGTDCLGTQTLLDGSALTRAKLTVQGQRTELAVVQAISPDGPDSATVELQSVLLTEFSSWTVPSLGRLSLHSGTLSATVRPTMGEERSKPGVFDLATPAASLSGVSLQQAHVTLQAGTLTFDAVIADSTLTAINGTWHGQTNSLEGSLTVNGKTVVIAPEALDPAFVQARFDQSYACMPNLRVE
jgi:hypothetical protein